MASSLLKEFLPSELRIENTVIVCAMEYIYDAGRIVPYDDLLDIIETKKPVSYELLSEKTPDWSLMTLLKEVGHIFYVFAIDDYYYVSYTRNYTYINPRFAKELEKVTDKVKESLLACPKENVEDNKLLKHVETFQDYELGKCSLAILEILNVVYRCVPKGKYKVPFRRIVNRYDSFSPLAKSIIRFCGEDDEDNHIRLQDFLELFKFVFKFDNALLSVDFDLLDGLIKAYETDLVWSYAGICVTNRMTLLEDIRLRVNEMITKAKLKFTTEMSPQDLVDMFSNRFEQFFLPGDGTVQIMYPCIDVPTKRLEVIREFFINFMKKRKKRLHYTKCYEVLQKNDPKLFKEHEDQTNISLVSVLIMTPDKFSLVDGFILLTPEDQKLKPARELPAIDVPITMFTVSYPNTINGIVTTFGFVHEVGIKSVTIRFSQSVSSIMNIPESNLHVRQVCAFGHILTCKFEENAIDNFSLYLKVADFVKFAYLPSDVVNIHVPMHCTVVNISAPRGITNQDITEILNLPPENQSDSSGVSSSNQSPLPSICVLKIE